ncbi:MAG TPA: ABC transporter ATP-binding protein [Oscillospiraceae bacterium]|nr:ABC transporter ATP-binding protein [Oscillospiraceae bacterium]HNW04531.1 ABC transporter ATP-binding protein [Oscillospiraceae bacterium]
MKHLIEIRHVNKLYKMGDSVVEALRDVSFSVDQGEYVAVLGPSGSGKSTLMNIVGCMDTMTSGEYDLAGIPIHRMRDSQLTVIRNVLIGFIFQRYHLISTYTVLQNVMMPLLVRGAAYRDAEKTAAAKLAMLGMGERLGHRPNELSGGQQQRVAIARALVCEPKLLLADEPTGALDSATGKEVMKLFAEINGMGHTVVSITHDLNVASYARRIVRIVDGELTDSGETGANVEL